MWMVLFPPIVGKEKIVFAACKLRKKLKHLNALEGKTCFSIIPCSFSCDWVHQFGFLIDFVFSSVKKIAWELPEQFFSHNLSIYLSGHVYPPSLKNKINSYPIIILDKFVSDNMCWQLDTAF